VVVLKIKGENDSGQFMPWTAWRELGQADGLDKWLYQVWDCCFFNRKHRR